MFDVDWSDGLVPFDFVIKCCAVSGLVVSSQVCAVEILERYRAAPIGKSRPPGTGRRAAAVQAVQCVALLLYNVAIALRLGVCDARYVGRPAVPLSGHWIDGAPLPTKLAADYSLLFLFATSASVP